MLKPIITLKNLTKSYDNVCALETLNLDVQNGEFLTLLGPSGCGKTTLLRILAGFETPDQGVVIINNENVTNVPPEARHVNMVFQSYALFPHMTIFDNVAFGLECQKLPRKEIERRVNEALARVKLDNFANRMPAQLSGGQQQRVAIARAVVNEPLVLLLDEPLSALDYHLRCDMQIELKALQRRLGITFILVTHDQEEALLLSDRVVVMNHGRIEQVGPPRDIYEEPKNLYVAKFIGRTNIFKTRVLEANNETFKVNIANIELQMKNDKQVKADELINIIVRPEDFRVWGKNEVRDDGHYIPGVVAEVIYKGSTVDLLVKLQDDQHISATEFFDEDDENLEYEIGERVLVEWKPGWEVILRDKN